MSLILFSLEPTPSEVVVPETIIEIETSIPSIVIGLPIVVPETVIEVSSDNPAICNIIPAPETIIEVVSNNPAICIMIPVPETIVDIGVSTPDITFFSMGNLKARYLLTITGSADSTTDIELPMSSFQSRRKSGEETYLSVVIPTLDYATEISDRANGTIKVDQAYELDGELVQRETILEVEIDNIKIYQGGRNQSVVLDGYKTTTYIPKAITLSASTYRAVTGGKIRYRLAEPNIFLNPGDTVTIGLDTFIIGVMSYTISKELQQIELEEA